MCYMMSKREYLNDQGKHWHPHIMVFVAGDCLGELGSQSARLAGHRGKRPRGADDDHDGPGRRVVRRNAGSHDVTLIMRGFSRSNRRGTEGVS